MAGYITRKHRDATSKSQRGTEESPFIKWLLIMVALAFTLVFLLLPLVKGAP